MAIRFVATVLAIPQETEPRDIVARFDEENELTFVDGRAGSKMQEPKQQWLSGEFASQNER